ncbi:chloride channel protein, partial [Caballeronia terrestris]|uniref:chloride channel protein n=1 Tax=Caballeronia terrestris TaxID=1226301 RepID=UPI00190F0072
MLIFWLKLRGHAQQLFRFSDSHMMLVWAVAVGVAGACATALFREGIRLTQALLGDHTEGLVALAESLPWYIRILLPAAGGLVAGGCLIIANRRKTRQSSTDYMEAVTIGDGVVPVWQSAWRGASSLLTITSGGSIGREGSMVQLAALVSSLIGRWIHFDPPRLRLLVACGAAAGITSAYNAPIAGAFFVT